MKQKTSHKRTGDGQQEEEGELLKKKEGWKKNKRDSECSAVMKGEAEENSSVPNCTFQLAGWQAVVEAAVT